MRKPVLRAVVALACAGLAALLSGAAVPAAATRDLVPADRAPLILGGTAVKAVVDTVTLMGPGGAYLHRGDFETADALPWGDGLLTDGWTSHDETTSENHWHVDTYNNPGTGQAAWCGKLGYAACDAGDAAGGYGNNWRDVLEFRKAVAWPTATVRVQATLRFDTEPGYDYVRLQRRTAASPDFEPLPGGQGLSWDDAGDAAVDFTFTYAAGELVDGDVAIAFVVESDGAFSDVDCQWPTAGAAIVDDIVVTVTAGAAVTTYAEDFEDGAIGPDWGAVTIAGVGDFARVWQGLCDDDPCVSNPTKQVAFIDLYPELLVVPPPPAGCGMVNNTGGFLGRPNGLRNDVWSPVMALPGGNVDGVRVSFDVYVDEPLIPVTSPLVFWTWSVRSTAGADIEAATWLSRNFLYYGGPRYRRVDLDVGDLLEPDATSLQLSLGAYQFTGLGYPSPGTDGSPAPYFDNVRVQVFPAAGPRLLASEYHLANDGFPASGALDLANLGANSVRFDMAKNVSTHMLNDPGDSICVDATPRAGATSDPPVLHWTLARRNPMFDPYRTLPPAAVTGHPTWSASGALIRNRWNFDLPDTGFLFPGDVLHYYISATDHRAGDARTSTLPADLAGYGDPHSRAWPGMFSVRCLPSLSANGAQPWLLLWNDQGHRGAGNEWTYALHSLGVVEGLDYDVFTTMAPTFGVGNGLGGRATPAQVAGYHDLLYTSGDLGSPTISNGDPDGDAGDDLGLLQDWLALGSRDLFLCGDDLAGSLYAGGAASRAFLESTMGLQYVDGDVRDDIGGQVAPTVAKVSGNPVFLTAAKWVLYGGCPSPNDFDAVLPQPGAVTLARFTDPGGTATPYANPAAVLKSTGTNRVITLPYDLSYVMSWDKSPASLARRAILLSNVIDFFGVPYQMVEPSGVPGAAAALSVTAHPNPFNPSVALRWTLAKPGRLAMKVFDARGALVRTLVDGPVEATAGVVTWDGADDAGGQAASGLYFVETRAEGQVDVRKVTMLK